MNKSGAFIGDAPFAVIAPDEQTVRLLEDSVHELAQPLTALSFILDLALLRSEPEAWREGLAAARTECRRAVMALGTLRVNAFPEAPMLQGRHLHSENPL